MRMKELLSRCYDVYLLRIELGFIMLLLTNVVGLSLLLILSRNLHFFVGDPSATSRIIFASAFLACLYGGCLATRANRHIAIDAFASHLPEAFRVRLEGSICFLSAGVSGMLYFHAMRYLSVMVHPTSSLAPASDAWFLREWLWKLPIAGAFALIALHFLVRGIRIFRAARRQRQRALETAS